MVKRALVIVSREHAGNLRHACLAHDGLDARVRQPVSAILLPYHIVLVGQCGNLRQMRDDNDLRVFRKRREPTCPGIARGTSNAGIDLVKDDGRA